MESRKKLRAGMAALPPEPEPGDMIEIFRVLYKHWAVYVGRGYVVHLTSAGVGVPKAVVKKDLLLNVVGRDCYQINNENDKKYHPKPRSEIVQEANSLIGRGIDYSVLRLNCEHFANFLRYGTPDSKQAKKAEEGLTAGMLAVAGGLGVLLFGTLIYKAVKSRQEEEDSP